MIWRYGPYGMVSILGEKYHICDMCGVRIEDDKLRYALEMKVFAAYDTLKLGPADLARDYEVEIRNLVEEMKRMDPRQLEEDVSKQLSFDLCRTCHQKFLKNPLGRRGARTKSDSSLPPFDVDEFLRRIREE
jgi:hypothetical protein